MNIITCFAIFNVHSFRICKYLIANVPKILFKLIDRRPKILEILDPHGPKMLQCVNRFCYYQMVVVRTLKVLLTSSSDDSKYK